MTRRVVLVLAVITAVALAGCGSGDSTMNNAQTAQAELAAALRDTPVPPGTTLTVSIPDKNGTYESGYGTILVQGAAVCKWFEFWLAGLASSRPQDVALASTTATKFPSWEIYRHADASYRQLVDGVVADANLGDPGPMQRFVSANCGG